MKQQLVHLKLWELDGCAFHSKDHTEKPGWKVICRRTVQNLGLEPEVGLVFDHVSVKGFPKAQEDGPVQVAPVAAQLQHRHIPLLHIWVRLGLIIFQMKSSNFSKYVDRRSVRQQPGPALELPGRTLHKHSHNSIPVLRGQFEGLINDSVRDSDTEGGASWLDLVFASLEQNLIVSWDALLLFII